MSFAKDEPNDSDEPGPEHLKTLSASFGHTSFRPMQWRIIHSIIVQRRDNCAIMTTGYGKSLTYQFPSVFLDRLTFVVSPLISLMQDQVMALNLCNIPACLLGSAQKESRLADIKAGLLRVVYLTPEYRTETLLLFLLSVFHQCINHQCVNFAKFTNANALNDPVNLLLNNKVRWTANFLSLALTAARPRPRLCTTVKSH